MKKKQVCIRQADSSDCGAACLASVAWHFGLKLPMSTIRLSTKTDANGTNVLGIVTAAEQMGFAAKGVRGNERALAEIPLPAIAHMVMNSGEHHFVVLYQMAAAHALIADPARGIVRQPRAEFLKQWSGVLVLLSPGPRFVAGNHKESNLRRFIGLVKPYPQFIIESFVSAVVFTLLGFSTALYIQYLVDNVFPDQNRQLLNVLSLAMIALVGFRIFFGWMRQMLLLHLSQKIDAALILGYYKHLLTLPQSFFDSRRIGDIISRINDAVKIRYAVSSASLTIVVDGLVVAAGFFLMFLYSWKLAMTAAFMIPALLLLFLSLKRAVQKTELEIMERSAHLQAHLVSTVGGAATIKLFQAEAWNNLSTEYTFIQTLRAVFRSGMQGIINANGSELITSLAVVGLLWMGGGFVIDGEMSAGELLSFYTLMGAVTAPAGRMIGIHQTVQDAMIAADRLYEIMSLETESSLHQGCFRIDDRPWDAIRFQHVSFRYGARKLALDDVTLSLPRGKMTAIVGESGSGKSTIVKLLTALYPCTQGEICFGESSIGEIRLDDLRSACGVVPQEIELFHGSVMSNVAYGAGEPDHDNVIRACRLAGADQFIRQLPGGWNTVLGDRGMTLSGGERQRLALARALYKRPSVLILDEATSSLDSESEAAIQEALCALVKQGMTVVAIAHRLSTIMHADKIIVLDRGKVAEEGTHQSLMRLEEKYYLLWKRQMPFVPSMVLEDGDVLSAVGGGACAVVADHALPSGAAPTKQTNHNRMKKGGTNGVHRA